MENQTKKCKHCQSDIPKKAKVCPNCRRKQGGILKWIIIAFVVIGVLGSIGGNSEQDDLTQQKASDSNPVKVNEVKIEDSIENSEDAEQPKINNEFKIGDVVETSSFKISFISADEYVSDNQFITPKDGHVFYRMEFEFENVSDKDQTISSMLNWTCYADDYAVDQSWIGDDQIDASISPSKKVKGAVYFEVPKDAESIVLEYETNFWSEKKVVFIVK